MVTADDFIAKKPKQWQHRTVAPEETLKRLGGIKDAVGITRVADLTELDRIGIPVFQAVRPLGKLFTVSQGKGTTAAAARASAMMEATEIWHAENLVLDAQIARRSEIMDQAHLDPGLLCRKDASVDNKDVTMEWAAGQDLISGVTTMVPRDFANLDFTRRAKPSWLKRSTNGLAGGNTFGEALASALAEVIERACRSEFERLDPQSRSMRRLAPKLLAQDSPDLENLIVMIEEAGLELDLFDLTNGLGVTTIKATIYEAAGTQPEHRPSQGHGAHLDPVTAVCRAITEAAQTRMTYISGNRDDLDPVHYESWNVLNTMLALERQTDLATSERALDLSDKSTTFPEGDVEVMLGRIAAAKAGPVVSLDLTHSDLDLPVAKILAPRLSLRPD